MELIAQLFDFILHIDVHLDAIIRQYGIWTYAILFLIIFVETGLVVMPLLPGDSLLFAAGTFAARGSLSPHMLFLLLTVAAILGDTVNYWIGHYVGPRAQRGLRFVKQEYLDRTHAFYEKHGGKTIIIARFMPIVRTFAPFVPGSARWNTDGSFSITWSVRSCGSASSFMAATTSATFRLSSTISRS